MNVTCPACNRQISELATHCPYCRAEIDQSNREAQVKAQEPRSGPASGEMGPGVYICLGLAVGILAGGAGVGFGLDTTAGVLALTALGVVAQILVLIGVIAKGVQVGSRSS